MIYAGIGSRVTPDSIMQIMDKFALYVAKKNFILRSGAAAGADSAFEFGCDRVNGPKEIYLPWKGFRQNPSQLFKISKEALDLAKKFHPAWERCSDSAKSLMARNCYQILGSDLKTPADFVVCWTKDGYNKGMARSQASGGTGQAIEIALANKIQVYNIFNSNDLCELRERFR